MLKLYTDAAVKQSTQKSAAGILIVHEGHQIQLSKELVAMDNHTAEFQAAIAGFTELANLKISHDEIILFYSDSKILIDALNKQYAKHYQEYVDKLIELQSRYQAVVNEWIADNQNKGAHNLAIQKLHHL
ncbi:ribonuclease HI family protein [Lentilactobacillus sp. Marseille-Q4993]|uniref:ribonuclease HI family protein n=1 Tax=Lentilactobacillus sp. Marseille-Q4993 TaxID=3039492 RepID=UPI0024BC3329|nr:ribonuclease HI family protein [Lentilactobacillus sp. Marseille-Q4993]